MIDIQGGLFTLTYENGMFANIEAIFIRIKTLRFAL